MATITPTPFLEQVFSDAKERNQQTSLTADLFLAELMIALACEGDQAEERAEVETVLEENQVIRSEFSLFVLEYDDVHPITDVLQWQKLLHTVREEATAQGKTQYSATDVVNALFENPFGALKVYLEKGSEPSVSQSESEAQAGAEQSEATSETKASTTNASIAEMAKRAAQFYAQSQEGKERLDQEFTSPSEPQASEKEQESENPKDKIANLVSETKRIRAELKTAVYGQDHAINVLTTGFFQASMRALLDQNRTRPLATFLFAGPPGVGKTFLAEQAAQALQLPFMRFDMSEYADKEANLEFCGADKVYKNAKAGNVTAFVAEHPKCVLLFDEIEKAHTCVIHLFLQILDAGRLRDNYTDEEVSFTDAIIILTTNAGRKLYEDAEDGDFSAVSRKVIINALQKDVRPDTGVPYFPGAICSRFASGNVVMFNHITAHNLRAIAKKEILRHAKNMEEQIGIQIDIDEKVYTALLFSEGASVDARTIRGRAETFFHDELYELLRLIASEKVKSEISGIETIRVGLDLDGAPEEIRALFCTEEKPKVLVFAPSQDVCDCQKRLGDLAIYGAQTVPDAIELLQTQEIAFVLLDMNFGVGQEEQSSLNIEDVASPARDFYKFLREHRRSLPVYLLQEEESSLSEEEKVTFLQQGVRGVLCLHAKEEEFSNEVMMIASNLHQQAGLARLAKENKLVSFETAQSISQDGLSATIRLFDFAMGVALDSEDSKNVLGMASKPTVRFADVIGADDAKAELSYFVEYLKNPKKYLGTGVKAPKGVLLYGPPGTGKTLLAKAMACESNVTYIAAEGNQFLKKYVGEGPEKVHELFRCARKYAPAILFIDEIDAIAKERKGSATVGAGAEEVLTAFLTEMDGFTTDTSKPVFVLAATNFDVEPGGARSLDGALMRRFDRRVYIELPNKENRIRFLEMKLSSNRAFAISKEMVENIAMRSTGMSLAELDSVAEFALRSVIREGGVQVTDAIFEEAFETFRSGEVKKWDVSQLKRTARHEAGHAFLCWESGETPSYLTVVARGNHGGYMQHADQEGKAIYTEAELRARIRTSLGGRAAEIVYYGAQDGISTGAGGDLASATALAQQIVCTYGMDANFGLAVVEVQSVQDGALAQQIRATVNAILHTELDRAIALIRENQEGIDTLVEALLTKNHLTGEEIDAILSHTGK